MGWLGGRGSRAGFGGWLNGCGCLCILGLEF